MNKKMMLMAALLINMVAAVFGTDFEERITEKNVMRVSRRFLKNWMNAFRSLPMWKVKSKKEC